MGLMAAVANNKIYAIGGRRDETSATAEAIVEQYDPATHLWTPKNPIPSARYFAACAVLPVGLDEHIVVAGGENAAGDRIKTVEKYNPLTNQWSALNFLSIERSRLAMAQINGRLYAVGGFAGNAPAWVGSVEQYDPGTGSWTALAPMPTARGHLALAVINGKLLATGGENATPSLNQLESYDPGTNLWSTKTPSPTAFTRGSAGVINSKVYVVGSVLALEYDPANETN
jgi:N-acetylneuraminic acid mutarotase